MYEGSFNIKESAQEWDNNPPEFHHEADFEQAEKGILKKEKQKRIDEEAKKDLANSDLTMDFLLEHEKKNQIRNISIPDYTKIGDHVVSVFINYI